MVARLKAFGNEAGSVRSHVAEALKAINTPAASSALSEYKQKKKPSKKCVNFYSCVDLPNTYFLCSVCDRLIGELLKENIMHVKTYSKIRFYFKWLVCNFH